MAIDSNIRYVRECQATYGRTHDAWWVDEAESAIAAVEQRVKRAKALRKAYPAAALEAAVFTLAHVKAPRECGECHRAFQEEENHVNPS